MTPAPVGGESNSHSSGVNNNINNNSASAAGLYSAGGSAMDTSGGSGGCGQVDSGEPVVCTNCVETVRSLYTECAECTTVQVRLCLQCFSSGAECGPHDRTHNYRIYNSGGVPIFGPSTAPPPPPATDLDDKPTTSKESDYWRNPWTSSEEMALLEAVERYNLGNWEQVAENVNPLRSAREVKEHYDKFYLRGRLGSVCNQGYTRPTTLDHSPPPATAASAVICLSSPPIRPSITKINADDLRLLAYMPHRDDFEKEWNNETEKSVSDLMLNVNEDDDLDRAVKLAQVDMYIREVKERKRRKAIARDYELVPAFFKQERPTTGLKAWKYSPMQMKEMKLERDIRDRLKKLCQYMPSSEFDVLVNGLIKEKMLKDRIEELQTYKKKGITTLEGNSTDCSSILRNCNISSNKNEIDHLSNQNEKGSFKWGLPSGSEGPGKESASIQMPQKRSASGKECGDGTNVLPKRPKPSSSSASSSFDNNNTSQITASHHSSSTSTKKKSILSQRELHLCKNSGLHSSDYLLLKMGILKEELGNRTGVPFRTTIKADTKQSKLVVAKFMQEHGWISMI